MGAKKPLVGEGQAMQKKKKGKMRQTINPGRGHDSSGEDGSSDPLS